MPKIIFKQPTKDWNEGLPIGNGRLGAMIMGNPENTHLQCNEDTLWQGGFRNRNNPAAKQNLEKIRQLILAEKTRAAEELIQAALTGVPEFQRHYEPAGDIFIRNLSHGEVSDYVRTLDLATAVVTESYQLGENRYHTEMFASKPAQLMAYCVTSSQKSNTKFRLHLNRSRGIYDQFYSITNEDSILLGISGVTSDGGVQYAQFAKIVTDGKMELVGQYVVIEEFTTLMIYTTIATTYRQKDPAAYCQKILGAADIVAYEKIKAAHIEDYQKLYQTVSLDLGGQTATADVPTLLANAQKGQVSPYLIEIMFQFGRYLLIASSRPGSLPANLQGIWNKEMLPAWDAKYTININTEMDYWPAEKVGLSECHLALFDHLLTMYPNGQQTAETMYGLKGFVAHHNTDVWGDTAPQDDYLPATYWPFGGAWLCLHIWHHYEYTQDKEFLAKYFFLLEEAACFMAGFVMELPNGEMVTNPSVSPENSFLTKSGEPGYVSYGSTMDNQLLWELFTDYLAGCQLTEHDSQLVLKVQEILPKLPPHKIGKYGQLMEWYHDYEECEPGHRHISHLFGLFPGHKLKNETPEIYHAARVSLERRLANGGGHTGWSAAWLINLWANFGEGEKCYEVIVKQIQESTLPNLLDNHPPFQIDGNFGLTSGIVEALVQYYDGKLKILPALPQAWPKGAIRGARIPGNVSLDIAWENGELTALVIHGTLAQATVVYVKNKKVGTLKEASIQEAFSLVQG